MAIPPVAASLSDLAAGLIVYDDGRVAVSAVRISAADLAAKKMQARSDAAIRFPGTVSAIRFIEAGGARISLWEADPAGDALPPAGATCRAAGERVLADGDTLDIDGSRQTFVFEEARGDILLLQAIVRTGAAPFTAEYDARGRAYIGASSTSEGDSRAQLLASLLRHMEREDSVPAIAGLLPQMTFQARWQLMREMLAIDAVAAEPHLRAMAAGDRHPDVRVLASETLARFFPADGAVA